MQGNPIELSNVNGNITAELLTVIRFILTTNFGLCNTRAINECVAHRKLTRVNRTGNVHLENIPRP